MHGVHGVCGCLCIYVYIYICSVSVYLIVDHIFFMKLESNAKLLNQGLGSLRLDTSRSAARSIPEDDEQGTQREHTSTRNRKASDGSQGHQGQVSIHKQSQTKIMRKVSNYSPSKSQQ